MFEYSTANWICWDYIFSLLFLRHLFVFASFYIAPSHFPYFLVMHWTTVEQYLVSMKIIIDLLEVFARAHPSIQKAYQCRTLSLYKVMPIYSPPIRTITIINTHKKTILNTSMLGLKQAPSLIFWIFIPDLYMVIFKGWISFVLDLICVLTIFQAFHFAAFEGLLSRLWPLSHWKLKKNKPQTWYDIKTTWTGLRISHVLSSG